jgi:hypothetical protein
MVDGDVRKIVVVVKRHREEEGGERGLDGEVRGVAER